MRSTGPIFALVAVAGLAVTSSITAAAKPAEMSANTLLFEVAQQMLSADEYETLSAPWAKCLIEAADDLVDQPERARTVVDAAFVSCDEYETAFRRAQPSKAEFVDKLKSETMAPVLLARVMTVRAARADLRKEAPSPPLDYKRM
jgi:hypothetical protein